jgi:hypothetical protein
MLIFKKILQIVCLLLIFKYNALGQNNFEEGIIVYDVTIQKLNKNNYKSVAKGKLTLTQKGKHLIKNFHIENEFDNSELHLNLGKAVYLISKNGKQKIAKPLSETQIKKISSECPSLVIKSIETEPGLVIAGFIAEKASLTCEDSKKEYIVVYTRDWNIKHPSMFEKFPSFNYLPLQFEVHPDAETIINFELNKIEQKPLDNALFRIDKSYKVIHP